MTSSFNLNESINRLFSKLVSGTWSCKPLFDADNSYWSNKLKYNPSESKIEIVIASLRMCNKSRLNTMLTLLNKTMNELYDLQPRKYDGFNVIGSPDSTDIDVMVYFNGMVEPFRLTTKDFIDESLLSEELRSLGYYDNVKTRKLDVTFVIVDENGNVYETSKGDCYETQNIIYFTHGYHKQKHECPVKAPISIKKIDPSQKLRAISKIFLDNLKYLCLDPEVYEILHQQKTDVYNVGILSRALCVKAIFDNFVQEFTLNKLNKNQLDFLKTVILKLCQLILLVDHQKTEYNKLNMAKVLSDLDPNIDFDEIEWYLSRSSRGSPGSLSSFKYLMNRYSELSENYEEGCDWTLMLITEVEDHGVDHGVDNGIELLHENAKMFLSGNFSSEFIVDFVKSPGRPSKLMLKELITKYNLTIDSGINEMFHGNSRGFDILGPEFVKNHVEIVNQRTDEWCKLLKYYNCGRNTKIVPYEASTKVSPDTLDKLKHYWHLIRGCIGEILVTNFLNRGQWELIEVGLLVKEKVEGSDGIAPDLIIYHKDQEQLIPVEIKCLNERFSENRELRREYNLAKKQLQTSYAILQSGLENNMFSPNPPNPITNISKGMVIVIHLDDEYMRISCTFLK